MSIVSKSVLNPQWLSRLRKAGGGSKDRGDPRAASPLPKKEKAALDKGGVSSHLSGMVTEKPRVAAADATAPTVTVKPWVRSQGQTPAPAPGGASVADLKAAIGPRPASAPEAVSLADLKPAAPPAATAAAPAVVAPAAPGGVPAAAPAAAVPSPTPAAEASKPPEAKKEDDLRKLFTEVDTGNEELHKLAEMSPSTTARELADQAREVLALFRGA